MPARAGRNRRAANATVKALEGAHKVGDSDRARVEMFLALADAVDECPDNAALWRQYREAEITLREAVDDDAGLAEFLAGLSAPMGDVETR